MKNTLFEGLKGHHLPHDQQIRRLRQVIRWELTDLQRYTVMAYYFENRTLQQIANQRGVKKSTVWRTLKRAEQKIYRVLRY